MNFFNKALLKWKKNHTLNCTTLPKYKIEKQFVSIEMKSIIFSALHTAITIGMLETEFYKNYSNLLYITIIVKWNLYIHYTETINY